jgi:hypothetical protein
MKKYPLIGVCIIAVVLLVLGSLNNVVGYQSVQTSQQNLIKEKINQKELLFQTICDIANNKDIQRIILKSQMSRGIFPASDIPVLTKGQLKVMYLVGVMLSKFISMTRIQSMVQQYQLQNSYTQEEINGVIEKDAILNAEITQLKDSECDCENENLTPRSHPIICYIINNIGSKLDNIYGFLNALLYWASEHNKPLFARTIILFILFLIYIATPLVFLGWIFDCF